MSPIRQRTACAALLLTVALGCSQQQKAERSGPPNIVLIVADDLGLIDTQTYGSRYYETPNLTRLAREGMRFTSAYANPNCAPTRAALLTGRYSPRTGIYTVGSGARGLEQYRKMIPVENETNLKTSETTFAEALKGAGYVTVHMGKWHMGTGEFAPTEQGFDINVGGNESGSPRGGYFSPFENPQLLDGPEGEHLTDRLSAEAVRFIADNHDKPFLLYLAYYSVHSPIQAKEELVAKYRRKPAYGGQANPEYAAMVETLDTGIGKVLDMIDQLDLANQTVVIFYSDNGGVGGYSREGIEVNLEVTDNAPLRGGKGMLYEGGVRVPLIVRYPPQIPQGLQSDAPIACVDFFPTILEIAGLDPHAGETIDGTSFYQLVRLAARVPEPRPPVYWHFPGYLQGNQDVGAWRTTPAGAIRVGNHKLIEFFETGEVELYNLQQDLGEQNNLATLQPERAQELHAMLKQWRQDTGAPMPEPKP